jgi:hypothetical protein
MLIYLGKNDVFSQITSHKWNDAKKKGHMFMDTNESVSKFLG